MLLTDAVQRTPWHAPGPGDTTRTASPHVLPPAWHASARTRSRVAADLTLPVAPHGLQSPAGAAQRLRPIAEPINHARVTPHPLGTHASRASTQHPRPARIVRSESASVAHPSSLSFASCASIWRAWKRLRAAAHVCMTCTTSSASPASFERCQHETCPPRIRPSRKNATAPRLGGAGRDAREAGGGCGCTQALPSRHGSPDAACGAPGCPSRR